MKYSLYAFDFDLTLADTVGVSVINYIAAYSAIGISFDEKTIFTELGKSIEQCTADIRALVDSEEKLLDFEREFYRSVDETFSMVSLYDDVEKNLKRIKDSGAKIALVTNRKRSAIDIVLTKYPSICSLIDFFSTSDLTDRLKPLPDPLYLAIDHCGVKKEETLFIGDAKNDELCALSAGVDFIYMDRNGLVGKSNKVNSLDEIF